MIRKIAGRRAIPEDRKTIKELQEIARSMTPIQTTAAGTRGGRRRRAGTATVSGFAAEQPVASTAGVEQGAPGVTAEGGAAVVALAGVQGAPLGGAAVLLYRAV